MRCMHRRELRRVAVRRLLAEPRGLRSRSPHRLVSRVHCFVSFADRLVWLTSCSTSYVSCSTLLAAVAVAALGGSLSPTP